jgi:hypothetical protein
VVSKEGKNWSKILTALQRDKHIFLQIEGDEYRNLGEVYLAMGNTFKTGYPGARLLYLTYMLVANLSPHSFEEGDKQN